MKRIALLNIALFLLLLQGCALLQPKASDAPAEAPEVTTQNLSSQTQAKPESSGVKLTQMVGKNYIKGVILSLKYDPSAQMWTYDIDGIETTNNKLPRAIFNHKAVLANEGDIVYASFDGMRLVEMFVIKAGYMKGDRRPLPAKPVVRKKGTKAQEASSAGKRDKAHQILSVPEEETIKLR